MALATTYRRTLEEVAADRGGYLTTREAEEVGVPAVELRKLAQRGGVEHVGHGLYRFETVPRSPHDDFLRAVLQVGPDAYLADDAVLALHDLAQVNPRRIRVATRDRFRGEVPKSVEVVRRNDGEDEVTTYDGVSSMTVRQALIGCIDTVMRDRLEQATNEAARRGLIRRREVSELLRLIRDED
jgi:predicted transcriptional regulator of viral defense system